MKVSELIELLKDMPQNLEVYCDDSYIGLYTAQRVSEENKRGWDAFNRVHINTNVVRIGD